MDKDKIMKIILKLIKVSLLLLAVLFGIHQYLDPSYHEAMGIACAFLAPFLPEIIHKCFKTSLTKRMELVYYIYILFALHLGVCMNYYDRLPGYDKVVHFIMGVLSAVVAYYVLLRYDARYSNKHFRSIFIMSFALAVGVIWEFVEFAGDNLISSNISNPSQHGLDDTMWDLVMDASGALLGGLTFVHKQPQRLIEAAEVEVLKENCQKAAVEERKASKKSAKK